MPSTISTLLDSHHVFHPKQMDAIGERQKPTFLRRILGIALVALSVPFTLGIGTVFLTYWAHRKVVHIEKENRSDLDQRVQDLFGERVDGEAPTEAEVNFSAAVKGIQTGGSQSFMSAIQQLSEDYNECAFEANALMEAAIAHDNVPAAIALMNRYENVKISLFDVKSARMAKALIKHTKEEDRQALLDKKNTVGDTALHVQQNLSVIKELAKAGAEFIPNGKLSPLHTCRDPEIAKFFIKHYGSIIKASDNIDNMADIVVGDGPTALLTTPPAVMRVLIENGADVNQKLPTGETVLFRFTEDPFCNDPELIKLILSKFEDADEKKQFVNQVINGYSILKKLIQSENANVEVVQALIDAGANYPELQEGNSPLMFVKKPEVAACLIDAYDVELLDKQNKAGVSPLFTVKDAEVLKLMIEKGFAVDVKDPNGNTILHLLSSDRLKSYPELAELILSKIEDVDEKKALVNVANNQGITALGYVQLLVVVKALVEAGAEAPQQNTWIHCKDPEIAGYLMDKFGATINEKVVADEMISPLLLVKNAEVLRVLINKGLDVKAVDPKTGRTILHRVSEDWFSEDWFNEDADLVTLILNKVDEAERSDFVKLKAKLFDAENAAEANALSFAKSVGVAKVLIAAGIDPKELDTGNGNALFGNISADVAQFLIDEHGVERDHKLRDGTEAIHYVGKDIEIAKVLMGDRRSDHDWGHGVKRPRILENPEFAAWLAAREAPALPPADLDDDSSDSD